MMVGFHLCWKSVVAHGELKATKFWWLSDYYMGFLVVVLIFKHIILDPNRGCSIRSKMLLGAKFRLHRHGQLARIFYLVVKEVSFVEGVKKGVII